MSVTDLTAERRRAVRGRVLLHAIAFIPGFSIVFVALGASS
jgi:cytochrome c biogenesis protein CcdA